MIGRLLDTNVIAELGRAAGDPKVHEWARSQVEESLFLSILTIGEYEKGIARLPLTNPARSRYASGLAALEARFARRILPVSDPIVRRWGRISGEIKQRTGHSPSVIDTLLAATAIEHRLYLTTRNVRDVQESGAAVFNPWSDDAERFPLPS